MIERLDTAEFLPPKEDIGYVDIRSFHPLYEKMAFRANIIHVGPKGVGKSMAVYAYAAKNRIPIVTFDCSEDVRRPHLIGHYVLRGTETPFILGPVTTAFEIANEAGKCILNFEEINALTPQTQKILNPATDFRAKVEVPEARKVFKLNPNAKLWVTGSMNTSVYSGVYALNEDLKSRMRLIDVPYPSPQEEFLILKRQVSFAGDLTERVMKSLCSLATETRQKDALEYALSTRDLVQIAEDVVALGLQDGFRVAMGKFEGQDKATAKARMESAIPNLKL